MYFNIQIASLVIIRGVGGQNEFKGTMEVFYSPPKPIKGGGLGILIVGARAALKSILIGQSQVPFAVIQRELEMENRLPEGTLDASKALRVPKCQSQNALLGILVY